MAWTLYARLKNWLNGAKIGNAPGQLSLNEEFDNAYAGINAAGQALETHKGSTDHDGRYYTEAEIDSMLQGILVGQVPDGSITPAKLSFDPATQAELDAAVAPLMANPLTTAGDLLYRGASAPTRLGIGTAGQVLTALGGVPTWAAPATRTTRIGHTYAIPSEIKVASGDTDYVLPFFVSVPNGQGLTLSKARYRINSGTSATVKLTRNGVDISGFTGLLATTSPTSTTGNVTLADDDMLALVVTGVSGTPRNLSLTIFFDYAV